MKKLEKDRDSMGSMPVRVLHINFSDSGGAGNAARRSHLALLAAGVDSKMLVAKKTTITQEVYVLQYQIIRKLWRVVQLKVEAWLKRRVDQKDRSLRSANVLPGFILNEIERFHPDIVHLHWVNAGMLSRREIQRIKAKVVWTLHDLWPMTGSCHCAGTLMLADIAGQYPTTFEDIDSSGYSSRVGKSYRDALKSKPDGIVTLCRNFEQAVEKAKWLPAMQTARIPNCLDQALFCPVSRDVQLSLRKQLNLPEDKVLLLYGAAALHLRHKGMDLLMDSLLHLDPSIASRSSLVVVGGSAGVEGVGDIKCYSLGGVSDEREMAQVYQACDIFLCPSREDNFPNTVAESTSCGLPVVAFRTGGLPDMISHGDTGYLAEAFCIEDYAKGISQSVVNIKEWSTKAAERAKHQYDSTRHTKKMLAFYERILVGGS
jgi:glycosyltransferase involved in cell wall biosynthesis